MKAGGGISINEPEYLIIKPNSEPQLLFFKNAPYNDETLYGGAAGPGKTWALVTLPIIYGFFNYSGFRGQIFRRTVPQLEEWIVPLTKRYYPVLGGLYNDQKKRWTFPSGATMSLCYMQHPGDWENYASGNNTYQAFDEATQFHEENFTVEAWNRSEPGLGLKPFRVYASNPGGRSHRRFLDGFVKKCPAVKAGKLKWSKYAQMWWQPMKASDPVQVEIEMFGLKKSIKRQFIPGRVFDNEDLLRENPGYIVNLMKLGKDKARKLLEGDWGLVEGQFLEMLREDIHFRKSYDIPKEWPAAAGMDYGPYVTCAGIGRINPNEKDSIIFSREWTEIEKAPMYKAISYRKFLINNDYWDFDTEKSIKSKITTYADVNMFYENKDADIKVSPAKKFKTLGIGLEKVSKASPDNRNFREYANDEFKDRLSWERTADGIYTIKPRIVIFYDKCPRTAETLPALQVDPNTSDIMEEKNYKDKIDHWYDMWKYLIISWFLRDDKKKKEERRKRIEKQRRKMY